MNQAGNHIDDCLGGTDELHKYYFQTSLGNSLASTFQCWNDTTSILVTQLCYRIDDCLFHDDEKFCTQFGDLLFSFCAFAQQPMTNVEQFLCNIGQSIYRPSIIYFKFSRNRKLNSLFTNI